MIVGSFFPLRKKKCKNSFVSNINLQQVVRFLEKEKYQLKINDLIVDFLKKKQTKNKTD